jgi:hypothetical protein
MRKSVTALRRRARAGTIAARGRGGRVPRADPMERRSACRRASAAPCGHSSFAPTGRSSRARQRTSTVEPSSWRVRSHEPRPRCSQRHGCLGPGMGGLQRVPPRGCLGTPSGVPGHPQRGAWAPPAGCLGTPSGVPEHPRRGAWPLDDSLNRDLGLHSRGPRPPAPGGVVAGAGATKPCTGPRRNRCRLPRYVVQRLRKHRRGAPRNGPRAIAPRARPRSRSPRSAAASRLIAVREAEKRTRQ